MKRLPRANTEFGILTDAELITRTNAVIAGMTAQVAIFPAPPVDIVDLQGFLGDYITASALALKGSKTQTSYKSTTKTTLIQNLRSTATYVNQIAWNQYKTIYTNNLDSIRDVIISSGFTVSKPVTRPNPNGNTNMIVVLSDFPKTLTGRMNVNGSLRLRVKVQKKFDSKAIKTYWLQYRVKVSGTTPVNPWSDFTATNTRIQVTGLDAGTYEYKVAPVPGIFLGKDQLNWSQIGEVIVT